MPKADVEPHNHTLGYVSLQVIVINELPYEDLHTEMFGEEERNLRLDDQV